MNAEQARGLFEQSLDGELDANTQAALEAALQRDPALRAEYAELEALRRATAALAREPTHVDLLGGVQQKLRARSGGKFYRDRFAEGRGRSAALTWMLVVASVLVIAVCLWFALSAL
jgi:anti-sigma factor RsiW